MPITVVLHEATRTGAPRVGGLIAQGFARVEQVRVISLKDGPLVPWLRELVGADHLITCPSDDFSHEVPFADRVARATALLAEAGGDLVYVNSLAASSFVLAAKSLGLSVVLHVHEKADEIYHLLRHDLCKMEVLALADGVVLAADGLASDIVEVFGSLPSRSMNFGIAVDIESVGRLANAQPVPAFNAAGETFEGGERLVVGMCGHASPRKGSDIFLKTAAELPGCDFLWIGDWAPDEAIENAAYDMFADLKLPNLFVTGGVENPFAEMRRLDLFFLSSREDPNPLVLAEAIVLGVPILCFSEATAVKDRLGRSAILCFGPPNIADAVRVIRACEANKIRSDAFRQLSQQGSDEFDSNKKLEDVMELISRIREERYNSLDPLDAGGSP